MRTTQESRLGRKNSASNKVMNLKEDTANNKEPSDDASLLVARGREMINYEIRIGGGPEEG